MNTTRITHNKVLSAMLFCLILATSLIVGCSPQPTSETKQSDSKQAAVDFTWTADADCATCHTTETASMTDSSCLAFIHEKEGTTCSTCHTDTAGLASAHKDATNSEAVKVKKLTATSIDENICFSCHGSYEDLAIKTAGSSTLTDSNGTIVNPHAMPAIEDHAKTTCASCHTMHTAEPTTKSAPDYCSSCHHAGVYECNTCH
ncbi:MAG: cytochrome c3 family protein [Raoultibacter sp.]